MTLVNFSNHQDQSGQMRLERATNTRALRGWQRACSPSFSHRPCCHLANSSRGSWIAAERDDECLARRRLCGRHGRVADAAVLEGDQGVRLTAAYGVQGLLRSAWHRSAPRRKTRCARPTGRLARKYHPDVSKEPDAARRMQEINEANEVLRDQEKRAAYDAAGRAGRARRATAGRVPVRRPTGTRASSSTVAPPRAGGARGVQRVLFLAVRRGRAPRNREGELPRAR